MKLCNKECNKLRYEQQELRMNVRTKNVKLFKLEKETNISIKGIS